MRKYTEAVMEMVADLEEYYEAAGFADFHDRVLKDMDDQQIRACHAETFKEVDYELEEWLQKREEGLL